MNPPVGQVHEPDEALHDAEAAIEDARRLREVFKREATSRAVPIHVPLWALLEALDYLRPDELRQVAQRAEARLVTKDVS